MARITVVGGDTPLGREVRERLAALKIQAVVSSSGSSATEADEETAEELLDPGHAMALQDSDLVICAGTPEETRQARQLTGGDAGSPFVDLTWALEGHPMARLRSPLTDHPGTAIPAAPVTVIAHPAASVLALLLRQIQGAFPIRNAVAQVLDPASERGPAAVLELQQQVTALLSFRQMEKKVFDAQIGFNLLGRFGEDAPEQLQDAELRLERHLASLLAGGTPLPSLKLIQAPVFHGTTFSLWVEMEQRPEMEDLEAELESGGVDLRGPDVEAPSNVGVAGQAGVTASVAPDRNNPRAVWIYAAADNYRILADNAAAVAQQMLPGERV